MISRYKVYYIVALLASFFLLITSCSKDNSTVDNAATGTVTDVDGNVYKTIKIGDQWWMAENLKTTKYRNGDSIADLQNSILWQANDSTGAFCLLDNDSLAPGLLYNWYAVNDSNRLAPAGWHIPGDEEWKELEKHLGMSQAEADAAAWRGNNEGDKLKVHAPAGWKSYKNVWATNESGFTALAGSCRLFDGRWGDPGIDLASTGFWWSTTEHAGSSEAWYRYLDYKNSNVFRSHCTKNYGFSVRCIKD